MTDMPLRFYIPTHIYDDEAEFSFWLRVRRIYDPFWEVVRYHDWVVIEVIE